MTERKSQPGFRPSALDLGILVAGGAASVYAASFDSWLASAIAFVVLHFFLFCNVLRMSRPLELIWAAIFASLTVAAVSFSLLPWPAVFAASAVVTVVVAIIQVRKPLYHGVGGQKLNPRLPECGSHWRPAAPQ